MTDTITKAEMMAMLEVQKDAASQMQRVANSLADIAKNQEKILTKFDDMDALLSNGVCTKVTSSLVDKITAAIQPFEIRQNTILDDTSEIRKTTGWLMIIVGGASLIIIIAAVVLKVMFPAQPPASTEFRHDMQEMMQDEMRKFHQQEGLLQ
jgi:hypothetical protein